MQPMQMSVARASISATTLGNTHNISENAVAQRLEHQSTIFTSALDVELWFHTVSSGHFSSFNLLLDKALQ